MSFENVQAEFGLRADIEALRADGDAADANPDLSAITLIDRMNNVQPPVMQPRFRSEPLGRVTQYQEFVGFQPVTFSFGTDSWEPQLVALSNRDEIGSDNNPPVFVVTGLLRGQSGQRTSRMAYYCEGPYVATPNQLSQNGQGGLAVVQQCSKAGAWTLPIEGEGTEREALNIGPDPELITEPGCLWFIDSVAGKWWSNGREQTLNTANLLGLLDPNAS